MRADHVPAGREPLSRFGTRAAAIPLVLSGMLGAGLFAGVAPAAAAAGWWLFAGIPVAAVMAGCAAVVSARFGRGSAAGTGFGAVRSNLGVLAGRVCVSTSAVGSVAAMTALARSVESYLAPEVPSGFAAIVVLVVVLAATAGLHIRGAAAWLWLGLVLIVVAMVAATCFAIAPPSSTSGAVGASWGAGGIPGAGGVLFFAFLGFERPTASDTERDHYDRRAARVGIGVSCAVVPGLLLLMASALMHQLGPARLALSPAPVRDALGAAAAADLGPLIGVAVAVAMLPAFLAVLESSRSTPLAAVRDGEFPAMFGRIGGSGTPFVLDVVLGVAAAGLGFLVTPVEAIALASGCLLVHYALVSAAGVAHAGRDQPWLRRVSFLGVAIGVVLVVSMPTVTLLGTALAVLAGPTVGAVACRGRR